MSDVKLFPKRRATDQNLDGNAIGRLLTMTDLMALLLCFFILMYSTHDPADTKLMRLPSGIAPVVAPTQSDTGETQRDAKLTKTKAGLDLNYIAALFRQAQTRDSSLSAAKLETHDYALALIVPGNDMATAQSVIARLVSYGRIIQVFAGEDTVAQLAAKSPGAALRYFPQNRADIVVLVH